MLRPYATTLFDSVPGSSPCSRGHQARGSKGVPCLHRFGASMPTEKRLAPHQKLEFTLNFATHRVFGRSHACPAKPVQAWHRTPFTTLFATRPPGETFPQHVPVSGGCSRKVLLPVAARPDHKVVGPPAFFRVLWKIVNAVGTRGRGEPYVCRSASIGSMRAALRAG